MNATTLSRGTTATQQWLLCSSKIIQIKQVLEHSRAELARKQLNLSLGAAQLVNGLGAEALPTRVLYRVGPR